MRSLPFLFSLSVLRLVNAIGQNLTISFQASSDSLQLASRNSSVRIIVDNGEWPAVLRAADGVARDFGQVTGLNGIIHLAGKSNETSSSGKTIFDVSKWPRWKVSMGEKGGGVIIAGTLGKSSIIDGLVKDGRINVEATRGEWEAFTSSIVSNPVPGVSKALVIAGKLIYSGFCNKTNA
jgi:hypothetical protein